MCGIAGIVNADGNVDAAILDRMQNALRHRGPDGCGRRIRGGVGLVHTRLAIIDLETGDQPLTNGEDEAAALVANGEIYNFVELRGEMAGVDFRTRSDCEPPLHLYSSDGPAFIKRLRGMYALAIDDPASNRLILARDPFGIKPLYYAENAGRFAFASEATALIEAGLAPRSLEANRRDELLQLGFTTGKDTVFAGIKRVAPGETLTVKRTQTAASSRSAALPDGGPLDIGEAEALRQLDRALMNSVDVHQRSDVPYAMFLSGGIDSSAVLACMRDLNDRPVQAFTAGFSGTGVADERDHARAVAEATGAKFEPVDFGEEDFWSLLPEIVGCLDDPAADYAILPTYKLGRLARKRGYKVVLSGEGGDEMFAGYGRYRRALRPRLLGGRKMRARGIFDGLGVLRNEPPVRDWRKGIERAGRDAATSGRTRLQVAQATDCADWLPNDLLIKLDRCLMAHGVEGRTPLLDPVIAEFAFRLPDRLKVRRGHGKWLLRQWLAEKLPAAKPFEAKRGFTVPVGEWIAARGSELAPLVAAQPGVAEACRPDAVHTLFRNGGKRSGQAAWTLLFFALWHQRHILGMTADGDVFAALAAKA